MRHLLGVDQLLPVPLKLLIAFQFLGIFAIFEAFLPLGILNEVLGHDAHNLVVVSQNRQAGQVFLLFEEGIVTR